MNANLNPQNSHFFFSKMGGANRLRDRRLGFLSSNMRSLTPLGHWARRLPLAPHRAKLALLGMAFGAEVQEVSLAGLNLFGQLAQGWPFTSGCNWSYVSKWRRINTRHGKSKQYTRWAPMIITNGVIFPTIWPKTIGFSWVLFTPINGVFFWAATYSTGLDPGPSLPEVRLVVFLKVGF